MRTRSLQLTHDSTVITAFYFLASLQPWPPVSFVTQAICEQFTAYCINLPGPNPIYPMCQQTKQASSGETVGQKTFTTHTPKIVTEASTTAYHKRAIITPQSQSIACPPWV